MKIEDIITSCGGSGVIAKESRKTLKRISADAVLKWKSNGIPEIHWPLISRLSDISVSDLHNANNILRGSIRIKEKLPNDQQIAF